MEEGSDMYLVAITVSPSLTTKFMREGFVMFASFDHSFSCFIVFLIASTISSTLNTLFSPSSPPPTTSPECWESEKEEKGGSEGGLEVEGGSEGGLKVEGGSEGGLKVEGGSEGGLEVKSGKF